MYKSPIEIMQKEMRVQMENGVLKAVQDVGINVDKAELLKALAYDREQYQKGYADGREAGREWISVEDRLPEAKLAVLAYGRRHIRKTETTELPAPHVAYTRGEDEGWFTWDYSDYVYVSHWMPLPEPPMEETGHV